MQKGLAPILIVILVAILGIGGYFAYQNQFISKLPFFEKTLQYPDDYIIPSAELPKHFTLASVPEGSSISNPSYAEPSDSETTEADQGLDPRKVTTIYHTVYRTPEEFGIMLIHYNSEQDLASELPEFIKVYSSTDNTARFRLLKSSDVLIFIWTDGNNYNDLKTVATWYEGKRGIQEVNLTPQKQKTVSQILSIFKFIQ